MASKGSGRPSEGSGGLSVGTGGLSEGSGGWCGCYNQKFPNCLKTASGLFYDEKKLIPRRKKFLKIIIYARWVGCKKFGLFISPLESNRTFLSANHD